MYAFYLKNIIHITTSLINVILAQASRSVFIFYFGIGPTNIHPNIVSCTIGPLLADLICPGHNMIKLKSDFASNNKSMLIISVVS